MMRAKNDATLNKLGDIYQYYIALFECFKMKENDKVLIEVRGDVSKVSKIDSFQMEVKHHIGDDIINERNKDLWNTLKNWYKEYDRIKDFDNLIFFTTSDILETSPFYKWELKSTKEKLKTLKSIGRTKKDKEATFRKLYKDIFSDGYDETIMIEILSKVKIECKQKRIASINQDFKLFIPYIPEGNRQKFIAALLGLILEKVTHEPYYWEITYDIFVKMLQETMPLYINDSIQPIPTEYATLSPPDNEVNKLQNIKFFVQAIKNIDYNSEIADAIMDYWRMNKTILHYYDNNFIFNKSILAYRDSLIKKLNYTKKNKIIDYKDSERKTQIKESKKMYNDIMAWDANPFESVNPNQSFFQRGIIHDIVDGKKFIWDIGD